MNVLPKKQIYIASSLLNINRVRKIIKSFEQHNISITYDWTKHGQLFDEQELKECGEKETDGVINAQALFFIQPGRAGSHVELGIAIAQNMLGYHKPIIILEEQHVEKKPFYYLDFVTRFTSEQQAIEFTIQELK